MLLELDELHPPTVASWQNTSHDTKEPSLGAA